ncbi:MAG: hypothetical protein JW731_02445 [Bacteroidales bacterium]|nr:hypothetical protein [Bacteroidales bacterium]
MKSKYKSLYWWIFSVVFTLLIAYYQRSTGPTYPRHGKEEIAGATIKYSLPRSCESGKDARIIIKHVPEGTTGELRYKRFKTNDEYAVLKFTQEDQNLATALPSQPPAGKLEYQVIIKNQNTYMVLNEEPVVIRFTGPVPAYILIPHILLMFLALLFSTRTGIEVIFKGEHAFHYTRLTLIFLFFGGMILGPVVQKFAFDAFWTGWPFGQDLTDNKTLVAFAAWIIAFVRLRKDRTKRGWALAAAIILLAVYLIPHSLFGSELDYSTGEIGTGN